MGSKKAFFENLTPYPFLECRNTPLVRISLKSGENSDLAPLGPIWPRFRAKMGSNTALPENLTPYPFLKYKNTPLVQIWLKLGEKSDLTPFVPVSGPKWGQILHYPKI